MKTLICHSPGILTLAQQASPQGLPAGYALVAVSYVGICGTDYHIFEGKHPFLNYPRVMGHEVSGRIMKTDPLGAHKVGDAVIINPYLACEKCHACLRGKPNCCAEISVLGVHQDGAMCEEILVPTKNLYSAQGLSQRDAAMVEFLAIGAHAVRRANGDVGDRALVIGAGPIGIGTTLFARLKGQEITLLDSDPQRLIEVSRRFDIASKLILGPEINGNIDKITDGNGFDIVYDATGNAKSMQAAFGYVAHGGTLVFVSVVKDEIGFSDPEFHKREMKVVGSRNATHEDFETVIEAIGNGTIPTDLLVTHTTTMDDAPANLARWAYDKTGLIKAIITVGGQ